MGTNDSAENGKKQSEGDLPPVGKGVFVKNGGRDRLACLDVNGVWHDYYSGEVLPGEIIYRPYND
jgi:hypothetical protein